MIEIRPKCDPDGVFSVKRTCAELGVCHKTLRKLRRMGLISPCNSNPRRLKYTGQSIIDCWDKAKVLTRVRDKKYPKKVESAALKSCRFFW